MMLLDRVIPKLLYILVYVAIHYINCCTNNNNDGNKLAKLDALIITKHRTYDYQDYNITRIKDKTKKKIS